MRAAAFVMAVVLCLVPACSETEQAASVLIPGESGPLVVYAVNEPLRYFAARIGGAHVEAVLPAPSGVDPAFWLPEPEEVIGYQSADVILRNGAGYARWTRYASLPKRSQVDTSAGYHDHLIARSGATTHSHGPRAEHSHGDTAFTTWLDLELASRQARAVADALGEARPERRADFEAAWTDLERDLGRLDARLIETGAAFRDEPLLFSHPVYPYLQRRYGLVGASLEWEPDEDPGREAWRQLAARQSRDPVRLMVWEDEPLPETQRRLAELGIETLVFSPAANSVAEADWLARMRANVDRLEAAAPSE